MNCLPVHIESLEQRQLMSVTFKAHVLTLVGAGTMPNTITVGLTPDGQSVLATVSYPTRKGTHVDSKTIPLSKLIRLVNITGGNNSDLITIDQTNGSFTIPTHIKSLNGNDTVLGGDEPDRITLGNGIDGVNSGNGDDTILAGKGPDTMIGGSGNDELHAGRGSDSLIAGDGDDTFIDPYGHNTLIGGSGHDTFIVKNILLDPDNTYDPAKDKLAKYVPPDTGNNNSWLNGLLGTLLGSYLL